MYNGGKIMDDLITIIVPVYNTEKYVERCLKSIVLQTYKNLEIIVVNDGSLDNSLKICEKIAKVDERIKVFSKENGGLSSARNFGLKQATGKYIGFIDSDDYIEKSMYEYLYKLIKENQSQISICGHNIVEKDKIIRQVNCDYDEVTYDSKTAFKLLLEDKVINNFSCDKLFSFNLFKNVEFKSLCYHEDVGTVFKLFYNSKFVTVGNKPYYNYVMNANSISHNLNSKKIYDSFLAYLEIHNFVLKNDVDFKNVSVIRMAHAAIASINTFIRNKEESSNLACIINIKNVIKNNLNLILSNKNINKSCKLYCIMLNVSFPIYKIICKLNIKRKCLNE